MMHSECFSARLWVENDTGRPRIVWVEPWGEDYTLLSKQKLEIVARGALESPYFHLVEHGDSTQVYVEGPTNDYDVLQDGFKIECGHQRQAALDAGLEL